jgi:hypothetical protein
MAEGAPILIAGHSHTGSLGLMRTDDAVEVVELCSSPAVFGLSLKMPRPPNFLDIIIDHSAGRRVVLLWAGTHHYVKFLLLEHQFDFLSREMPAAKLIPDATLVPEGLVEEAIKPAKLQLDRVISRISKEGREVVLVAPPPPKDEIAFFLGTKELQWSLQRTGTDLTSRKICEPIVLLKAWHMLVRLMKQAADEHGARFIGVPRNTQDFRGFLRREFWHHDVTHGNALYGARLLEHIIATV